MPRHLLATPVFASAVLTFRKNYFFLTLLLFLVEVAIALFVHDRIVRPYGGDFLASIFLYCLLRSVVSWPALPLAIAALVLAYLVEAMQHVGLLSQLGLQGSRVARVVLGSSFSWLDMLLYTAGILLVIMVEKGRPDFYRMPGTATSRP
jgi:hypothetical protein